jgi:hypothetical protein
MIKSSEDANKYYNLVNQYVDEYVDKWKIKPTNLKNYLLGNKSRLVNFLERKGLKDVGNIDRVVLDVIEDRVAMHNDGVITFENFKLFESEEFKVIDLKQCLYKGVEKATINHEKILADFFDLSLSQIDPISPDKHTFWVNDTDTPVTIYTKEELLVIKENIIDYSYNQMGKKKISLDLGKSKFEIDISNLISEQQFKEKFSTQISDDKLIEVISSILYSKVLSNTNDYLITQMY